MRRALLFVLLVLSTGCTLDTLRSKPLDAQSTVPRANPNVGQPEEVAYDSSLNVDLSLMVRTPSGLYWQDVVPGTGAEAVKGAVVLVDYSGWLADASLFDTSKRVGKPYQFVLGMRQVIDGWDEGVAGMRVGGQRLLVIPPQLGYGSRGAGGVIPGNATLVFLVELRDVRLP